MDQFWQARVFDLDTFACSLLTGHGAMVLALSAHAHAHAGGALVATCSKDRTARIWHVREELVAATPGPADGDDGVAASATNGADGGARRRRRRLRAACVGVCEGHTARRSSAEHPIAAKALRCHSYGPDSSLSLRMFAMF